MPDSRALEYFKIPPEGTSAHLASYLFFKPMDRFDLEIQVSFKHRILFTRDAFSLANPAVSSILFEGDGRRAIALLEDAVASSWENLADQIHYYFSKLDFEFQGLHILPGGEACKADQDLLQKVWALIDEAHIDRHSYLLAIGGGAFLDAVGLAAATAHRGIRLIRFPTTTLSQDDSGVGVKNAINHFEKKNWLGTFSVPFAVINDFAFLTTQSDDNATSGLIEAIKVALVKDSSFFTWIEKNAPALKKRQTAAFEECVQRSAMLHARHIASGGDPFESGSSRPLDFGHWAAHKLEALTEYQVSHAEAVAIGLALDTLYSVAVGLLPQAKAERVLAVLLILGMDIYHPALDWMDQSGERRILSGLHEFREHLGGRLTILLLTDLGQGKDVHQMDPIRINETINELRDRWDER